MRAIFRRTIEAREAERIKFASMSAGDCYVNVSDIR